MTHRNVRLKLFYNIINARDWLRKSKLRLITTRLLMYTRTKIRCTVHMHGIIPQQALLSPHCFKTSRDPPPPLHWLSNCTSFRQRHHWDHSFRASAAKPSTGHQPAMLKHPSKLFNHSSLYPWSTIIFSAAGGKERPSHVLKSGFSEALQNRIRV